MSLPTFSKIWPHVVRVQTELKDDAWLWIQQYCWDSDIPGYDIFTSFGNTEFGFKDPKLAMEFKLRFG